jgi:phosphopantothenoylcysteine decarboxylase / phosphopantothenate---cysteine ligase
MEPLAKRHVLLGIGGSIAAYKAAELARLLVKAGAKVRPAPTRAATRFLPALTLEALCGQRCLVDVLELEDGQIPHVEEAYKADLALVAPASADLLAKMAQGIADEALLATLLSVRSPLVVAPAMESRMWRHPATQENVERLKSRGAIFIGPEEGLLASGREGSGRLASLERILEAARRAVSEPDLERRHLVITAGPTVEDFDPVRFLSNRSSGRMGYALALAASRRGARVTLVHGPTTVPPPEGEGIERHAVRSAAQMYDVVTAIFEERKVDAAILAAAVADYRPARASEQKLKKGAGGLTLELERTRDTLAELGAREGRGILVGFAAETENHAANARDKLAKKGCDLLCANDVGGKEGAFDNEDNALALYFKDGTDKQLARGPKLALAYGVLDEVRDLLRARR